MLSLLLPGPWSWLLVNWLKLRGHQAANWNKVMNVGIHEMLKEFCWWKIKLVSVKDTEVPNWKSRGHQATNWNFDSKYPWNDQRTLLISTFDEHQQFFSRLHIIVYNICDRLTIIIQTNKWKEKKFIVISADCDIGVWKQREIYTLTRKAQGLHSISVSIRTSGFHLLWYSSISGKSSTSWVPGILGVWIVNNFIARLMGGSKYFTAIQKLPVFWTRL